MKKVLKGLFVVTALIFCFVVYNDNDLLRAVTKPIPVLILLFFNKT